MRVTLPLLAVLCLIASAAAGQTPAKAAGARKPGAPAGGDPAPAKPAMDKAAIEKFVRHLFVWGPQVTVQVSEPKPSKLAGFQEISVMATAGQASQAETFLLAPDGRKLIRGVVLDLAQDPFADEAARIQTASQASFGPAEAPVSVVIYSDFQCSFCREEAKVLRENIPAAYAKDVKVIFKDFPLEQIHPWAKPAAIAGRCIARQKPAAFWEYHDWIFDKQSEITPENLKEKVVEFAKSRQIEPVQLGSCLDMKAREAEVNASMAEARALQINSTPTMFVNGRRLVGQLGWPQLKQILDHEVEYQRTHGSKCCEVSVPSLVKP